MTLKCDMVSTCLDPVTYVDNKGYVYCTLHGLDRLYMRPCRKLLKWERDKMEAGGAIAYSHDLGKVTEFIVRSTGLDRVKGGV